MWPYGYPPQPPNQPVVFIPSPGSAQGGFDIDAISRQIAGLEALKKLMKEDKKEDKKDDKPKPTIFAVVLLMLLISPITGVIMSKFFALGVSSLPH